MEFTTSLWEVVRSFQDISSFFFRCDGTSKCIVPVNSDLFHDACPGTHKYLEIHYACLSSQRQKPVKNRGQKAPDLPPWMFEAKEAKEASVASVNTVINFANEPRNQTESSDSVRKPILGM